LADGVIVGSALVTALSECRTPEQCRAAAVAFLQPIRQAMDLV
jgi:tryptophan synthase alpha chain